MTDTPPGATAMPRRSKSALVADELSARVRRERLAPGVALGTKAQLAEHYGVAAATLNEALRMLEAKGIATLKSGPRGGVFVGPATERADLSALMVRAQQHPDELLHLFQVQDALEVTTVVEAAIGCRGTRAGAIVRARDLLLAAEDVDAIVAANWEVDRAVARAGRNAYLAELYCTVVDDIERKAVHAELDEDVARRWRDIHVAIASAVLANDVGRAESLALEHSPQLAVEEGRLPL
jgi:DNA-binding FadR family transcriptional regulator